MSARYAPMNHAHIPGFPYRIPNVDWETCLPKLKIKNQKNDDPSLHLVRFHMHISNFGVELQEYYLMKIFMVSLEGMHGHGMRGYHQRVYIPLKNSIQYFMNILKINTLP